MGKLNVGVYEHGHFMRGVTELLEDILGRPISELEQPDKLIDDARDVIRAMRGEYLPRQSSI